MKTSLRILILEDNPADARLMALTLEDSGLAFEWQLAGNRSEFLAGLEPLPDVILADWRLPGFGAREALDLVRGRELEVPFIILTGVQQDDAAVEAIANGATDYLNKDDLGRLRFAVDRALAERRFRAEHAALEDRFRQFILGTEELVTQVDATGRFLFVNPRAEKFLGMTPAECVGTLAFDVVHPEDRPRTEAAFAGWVREGAPRGQFDNRVVSTTGEVFHLSWTINIHYDATGAPDYLFSFARDVTELVAARRQLEERTGLLEATLESLEDAVLVVRPGERTILAANRAVEKIFGYAPGELIGRNTAILHPSAEAYQEWAHLGDPGLEKDQTFTHRWQLRRRSGEIFWAELTVSAIDPALGWQGGVVSVVRDISREKAATDALEERVKELRCIFTVTDLANDSELEREAFLQQVVEVLPPAFRYPETSCARLEVDGETYTAGDFAATPRRLAAPVPGPHGKRGEVEVCYREALPADAGEPFLAEEQQLLAGVAERVGNFLLRRETVHALRETRLRLQHLLAVSPGALYAASAAPPFAATFVSDNVRTLVGFDPEEFIADPDFWVARIHPEDRPGVQERLERIAPGETLSYEYRFRHQNGGWVWILDSVRLFAKAPGRPAEFVGSWVDITERKRSEEELRRSEQRLKRAQAIAHLGNWELDLATNELTWSEEVYRIFGLPPQTFRPSYEGFLETVHPDDREAVDRAYRAALEGEEDHYEIEHRIVHQETGEVRYVQERCENHRDAEGRTIRSVGMVQDITERKQYEKELERTNRTLRVVSRCNEALVRSTSEGELAGEILRQLVETGGYPLALVWFPDGQESSGFRPVVHPEGAASALTGEEGQSCGLVGHLARICREPLSREVPLPAAVLQGDACCRRLVEEFGICNAFSLALDVQEEHLGCLVLFSAAEGFYSEEIYLLKELADDLAYGIRALRTETAHREAREMLRLRNRAIEASVNGIMISEARLPDTPLIYVNEAFERITGYTAAEVLGRDPRFLSGDDQAQAGLADILHGIRAGRPVTALVRNYRKDGRLFWNELSVAPVRDETGAATHFVSIINDVTARKTYEEELARKSNYDELTGLANRNLLRDRLEQAIAHGRRTGEKLALLLLDLDRFQVINDSLGHALGNELLRLVADRLQGVVRAQDTLARLGGDEFVVLFQDVEETEGLMRVVEKIRDVLAAPFTLGTRSLRVTASLGISCFPADGDAAETLLRNADLAMYAAKEEGRDAFHFFTAEMDSRVVATMDLEADLRRALEKGEFLLHFQPKVAVASNRIVGGEALVRWQHPVRGMVSPGEFIPLAEETGLIEPLGAWVLEETCRANRAFQAQGLPPVELAANISARQFRNERLVELVEAILERTGLEARWLTLELTESMIMDRPEAAAETMFRLKQLGVGLSLDDFGTGYSSLNYLRRFPVDRLKIDRSFINEVASDPGAAAVAESVIAIAHNLRLEAVAEGVETEEQLAFLRHCRCDLYQGFFYSRPVPADRFAELLRTGAGSD